MDTGESYLDALRKLSPKDRDEQIYEELTDCLHELVRAVERAHADEHGPVQGCVIDDLFIEDVELGEDECVVGLTFSATADLGEPEAEDADRITGDAEAVFDVDGNVAFRSAAIVKEHAIMTHDVGAGD